MMENQRPGEMSQPGPQRPQKKIRGIVLLATVFVAAAVLLILYPENRSASMKASYNLFLELVGILPAVMILMGLFSVWVRKETVVKYMGHASGVTGLAIALFLGMMPTGPLYVAFPMASVLLKKGARVANIMVFLSSWACIKLPQEFVELRFMGYKFMLIRLVATVILVIAMGFIIEKIDGKKEPARP